LTGLYNVFGWYIGSLGKCQLKTLLVSNWYPTSLDLDCLCNGLPTFKLVMKNSHPDSSRPWGVHSARSMVYHRKSQMAYRPRQRRAGLSRAY
jgi:hypothetical protein